jgi:hypothetical protein
MSVWVAKFFHLWMVSQGIIKFRSGLRTNTRLHLYALGVPFAYKKIPFGLKNVGATFQWAMSFTFHDLKDIVEAYLDDLASRSHKRADHPAHLRLIFERCRYYRIHLNPKKCNFCIRSRHLLGFIVSNKGIMVDPLKVEAIVQFPPPCTVPQLQSLQGKANFLR